MRTLLLGTIALFALDDLGGLAYSFAAPSAGIPTVSFNGAADFKGHIFRAGLNFKFDGGRPVVAKY